MRNVFATVAFQIEVIALWYVGWGRFGLSSYGHVRAESRSVGLSREAPFWIYFRWQQLKYGLWLRSSKGKIWLKHGILLALQEGSAIP